MIISMIIKSKKAIRWKNPSPGNKLNNRKNQIKGFLMDLIGVNLTF